MGSTKFSPMQLFRRRISRRVAFWIFVSIIVIEAIILIPSVRRQGRVLLEQLEDETAIKVNWVLASTQGGQLQKPQPTAPEAAQILQSLRALTHDSGELNLMGGVVYDTQGNELATFGDRPTLGWQSLQAGVTHHRDWSTKVYDSSWSDGMMSDYTIVLRHDISSIQTELHQYKLRIGALVVIISAFVTASTMLVMQILVITPVLKLRRDLQLAGELVIQAPENIAMAELHALNHHRRDELGDVMDEFRAMLTRITTEIQQRIAAEQQIRQEQEKSEELLLNILPWTVAKELKENRYYVAEGFAHVSVMFADLVGFTELSAQMSPTEIVTLLNDIFSSFDRLSEIYQLEKIKTIGDAYMVAGGLPEPQENHPEAIANMALEMLAEIKRINDLQGYQLQLRIGIHCGAVVAGVIGTRKFIYDLWGDTVNVASRMESQGVPGKIQVTEAFKQQLGDRHTFEARGLQHIKGKGLMPTYFLLGN